MRTDDTFDTDDLLNGLLLVAFVLPYVIATPIFKWHDLLWGWNREELTSRDATTVCWTMLLGLFVVLVSRRNWISRVAFGLIYLVVTMVIFIYWGLSSRGYYGRYWYW